ncbi:MAG: phosphoribosylanthranilate isomerase [Opitutales bacterium]|nr:phosphoribosylanthranilate isomerase [Opitutales bacterium]
MSRPKVKVCGMTRIEDIRLALDLGADYIGMIVYPKSPRSVSAAQLRELLTYVPEGKRVRVDVETPTQDLEAARKLGFDFYQMHFSEDVSIATIAAWSGLVGRDRLWAVPKIPPEQNAFPPEVLEFADTLLVDGYQPNLHGGTGKTTNWQRFQDWTLLHQHKNWILAGGLSPDNILQALEVTHAKTIDLNSGVESSPGIKDPEKLKQAFAVLS